MKFVLLKKNKYYQFKRFSCTAELSMKFFLLRNIRMPTTVVILIFISRKNFMLNWVEYEKCFITSDPEYFSRSSLGSLWSGSTMTAIQVNGFHKTLTRSKQNDLKPKLEIEILTSLKTDQLWEKKKLHHNLFITLLLGSKAETVLVKQLYYIQTKM